MVLINEFVYDFGCVKVMIDKLGSMVNNSWVIGIMFSKIFCVDVENFVFVLFMVLFYLDDNELIGWEWFNNEGWDVEDVLVYQFDGVVNIFNESSVQELVIGFVSYGGDICLDVSLSGLDVVSGFGVGCLSIIGGFVFWQENGNSIVLIVELCFNVISDCIILVWNVFVNGIVIICIFDLQGWEVSMINISVE